MGCGFPPSGAGGGSPAPNINNEVNNMLRITWEPEGYIKFDFNKNTGMTLSVNDKSNKNYCYFKVIMEGVFKFLKIEYDNNSLEKATNALIEVWGSDERVVKEVKVK